MQVRCVNSPLIGLGNSSITVLPCASPQPSLNLLVLAESGDVLGNFTSYKDEMAQQLRANVGGGNFLPVFRLDWTIQYNETDSSLAFQAS